MKKMKNAKGYYRQDFTFDGKRFCVYAKRERDLSEKQAAKIRELEKEKEWLENHGGNYENPSLRKFYDHFTDTRRREEIRESTIRTQMIQFDTLSKAIVGQRELGDIKVRELKRQDIIEARENLLKSGKTPEHLNIIFAHLNHVLNQAVIEELIDKNPCKALKKLKRENETVKETKHRALTVEETIAFIKAAEDRNSYYLNCFKLMLQTGLRVGELSALYSTDLDKRKNVLYVRRTISRDEIGNYYVSEETKTSSGVRMIPANETIKRIIAEQEELNRMIFGFEPGLLFRGAEGNIMREYSINREIKRICKEAEIEEFTCHAFRNTFATRFMEQRPQDFKVLSEIMGHKDVSITLNLYTHVMQESKKSAMDEVLIKMG